MMVHPPLKKDWPVTFFCYSSGVLILLTVNAQSTIKVVPRLPVVVAGSHGSLRSLTKEAECTDATSFPWFLADKHNGVA